MVHICHDNDIYCYIAPIGGKPTDRLGERGGRGRMRRQKKEEEEGCG